ncbi:MAG: class I SAM-dependent methyltransferase [Ilumatobacteraceae bacterium]
MTASPLRPDLSEHVAENRRMWDDYAPQWVAGGERLWASEPAWGIWGIPEADLPLMPPDLDGKRAIELGCGTGYVSAWMQRRGASVYAIDNSEQQLATARRLAGERGVTDIEWVHGNAEDAGKPDGSFDVAISEYGAAIWCDPSVWIPEAHRLLRPGGLLTFFGNHPLAMICSSPAGDGPVGERLARPYFGLGRLDWTEAVIDPGGIEFNLPISAWLRLFRETGFEVLDYLEVQAPEWATGTQFEAPAEWAKQWPAEQAWKLRKR